MDRGSPRRDQASALRRCHRSTDLARPGHRPAGQLVQPGTLWRPDRSALGSEDLREVGFLGLHQPQPHRRQVHRRGLCDRAADVPLRAAVEPADRGRIDHHRSPVPDRPRAAVRALRGRLLRRALCHRNPPDRPGHHVVGHQDQPVHLCAGVRLRCPVCGHRAQGPGDAARHLSPRCGPRGRTHRAPRRRVRRRRTRTGDGCCGGHREELRRRFDPHPARRYRQAGRVDRAGCRARVRRAVDDDRGGNTGRDRTRCECTG